MNQATQTYSILLQVLCCLLVFAATHVSANAQTLTDPTNPHDLNTSPELQAIPPQLIKQWEGMNNGTGPTSIAVSKGRFAVATNSEVLLINMQSGGGAEIVSRVTIPTVTTTIWKLKWISDTVLLAHSTINVMLIRVHDSQLELAYQLPFEAVTGIAVVGRMLFVAVNPMSSTEPEGRLHSFDIEDISNPKPAGVYPSADYYFDVQAVQDQLFVRASHFDSEFFRVFRVSGSNLEWLYDWDLDGDIATLSMADRDSLLLISTDAMKANLLVFRLFGSQYLRRPELINSYSLPVGYITSIAISDTVVLLHSGVRRNGYVMAPQTMVISGVLDKEGRFSVTDSLRTGYRRGAFRGSLGSRNATIATENGMTMWISESSVYGAEIESNGAISVQQMIPLGESCYGIGLHNSSTLLVTETGLIVSDFTDVNHPRFIDTVAVTAEGVLPIDQTHIITYNNVVTLLKESSPGDYHKVAALSLGRDNFPRSAATNGSLVALACLDGGMFVVSVENDSLAIQSRIPVRGTTALWIGNYLIVGEMDSGASVWDMSVPDNPVWRTAIHTSGSVYAFTMIGDTLVLGGSGDTYYYDMHNVTDPRFVKSEYYTEEITDQHFEAQRGYFLNGTLLVAKQLRNGSDSTLFRFGLGYHPDIPLMFRGSTMFVPDRSRGLAVYSMHTTLGVKERFYSLSGSGIHYVRPQTNGLTVGYSMANGGSISLQIINVQGKVVGATPAVWQLRGQYEVPLQFKPATGVYFISLLVDSQRIDTKKVYL